jgi:hypothetical protein
MKVSSIAMAVRSGGARPTGKRSRSGDAKAYRGSRGRTRFVAAAVAIGSSVPASVTTFAAEVAATGSEAAARTTW